MTTAVAFCHTGDNFLCKIRFGGAILTKDICVGDCGVVCATPKVAIIFGVLGQIGQYLADFLLYSGQYFAVIGVDWWLSGTAGDSQIVLSNLRGWYRKDADIRLGGFFLQRCDITDAHKMEELLAQFSIVDEIYFLAGISHPKIAETRPSVTMATNYGGVKNLHEAIRATQSFCQGYSPRVVHASSIRIFFPDRVRLGARYPRLPQNPSEWVYEKTYDHSKAMAHRHVVNMRKHSMTPLFACNAILSNCTSPLQTSTDFVVPFIVDGIVQALETGQPFEIRDLNAELDLCDARDTARALHCIVNQPAGVPDEMRDVVVAHGHNIAVWQIVAEAAKALTGQLPDFVWCEDGGVGYTQIVSSNGLLLATSPAKLTTIKGGLPTIAPYVLKAMGWKPSCDALAVVRAMAELRRAEVRQQEVA